MTFSIITKLADQYNSENLIEFMSAGWYNLAFSQMREKLALYSEQEKAGNPQHLQKILKILPKLDSIAKHYSNRWELTYLINSERA